MVVIPFDNIYFLFNFGKFLVHFAFDCELHLFALFQILDLDLKLSLQPVDLLILRIDLVLHVLREDFVFLQLFLQLLRLLNCALI